MIRENAFDAGELAIVTYFQAKAYGKPFVMLPIPVSGRTQHHCIGYNKELGHLDPKDIEGKKVGVRTYAQTTGLWVKGILQHEHGVDLDKVTWMTIDESHLAEYKRPAQLPAPAPRCEAGQDDAGRRACRSDPGQRHAKGSARADAHTQSICGGGEWCKREGVLPINHMFVVHQELLKNRPDVVKEIYRMLVESRNLRSGVGDGRPSPGRTRSESQDAGDGARMVV